MGTVKQLKSLVYEMGNILFPPRCTLCGSYNCRDASGLCQACCLAVQYVQEPVCEICGRDFPVPQTASHVCGQCLIDEPPFSIARSLVYYEEPVRSLLHNLKYRFDTSTLPPLRKIAHSFDFSAFEACDNVLPVPLHPKRLRHRGMNQALVLARLFFAERKIKIYVDVLRRQRPTISQTQLSAAARKKNVKSAFVVQSNEIVQNKRICLVDDIYTTGMTARECASTILQAGAAEVRVLTMARVRIFTLSEGRLNSPLQEKKDKKV